MPGTKADDYVVNLLSPMGLPIAYKQFVPTKKHPVPDPPYLIYYISPERAGGADDRNLFVRRTVHIELYTNAPDAALEQQLEELLSAGDWIKTEDYIESESMNMVSYEFDYFYKIRRK